MPDNISIFFEPIGDSYLGNAIFSKDPKVNLDKRLQPFIHVQETLGKIGVKVNTIDYYLRGEHLAEKNFLVSLGGMKYWPRLVDDGNIHLQAFIIFDCPVAYPAPYRRLDELLDRFEKVYSYSSVREMSRYTGRAAELHRFHWPLPYDSVSEPHWGNRGRKFLTTIIGNKRPACKGPELYSERIKAVKYFAKRGKIDLFGGGWDKPLPTHPFHFQWFFDRGFRNAWRGTVASKYDTLASYTFAICFENMIMDGWITEKIFDCFYTGTIPIYLGAADITDTIPRGTFIDFRDFGSYDELAGYLDSLSAAEIDGFRERAREYLGSEAFRPHTMESFARIFSEIHPADQAPLK